LSLDCAALRIAAPATSRTVWSAVLFGGLIDPAAPRGGLGTVI
jgi:hypothetical protein